MNYYFPNYFDADWDHFGGDTPKEDVYVSSAYSALRLILRGLKLETGSMIAIPAFTCDRVKDAVEDENLRVFYLDLFETQDTYWTDYSISKLNNLVDIKAVILVHLYGFIHPQTSELNEFCLKNKIPLIHDAAQCYGTFKKSNASNFPIVYSFSQGKSASAALGGLILNNSEFINCQEKPTGLTRILLNSQAQVFLRSRMINKKFSFNVIKHFVLTKLATLLKISNGKSLVVGLSDLQIRAIQYAINKFPSTVEKRRKYYFLLHNSLATNNNFVLLNSMNNYGSYYKFVFSIKNNLLEDFKTYLSDNQVPYFILSSSIRRPEIPSLIHFHEFSNSIIEISTECTIPESEIKRVSQVLKSFRHNAI